MQQKNNFYTTIMATFNEVSISNSDINGRHNQTQVDIMCNKNTKTIFYMLQEYKTIS